MPFKIKASAVAKVKPFRSKVAPLDTTVPAPVVPNGEFGLVPVAPNFKVPSLTVVKPV